MSYLISEFLTTTFVKLCGSRSFEKEFQENFCEIGATTSFGLKRAIYHHV